MPDQPPPRKDGLTLLSGPDHIQLELDFSPPRPPAPAPDPSDHDGPTWASREEHAAYLAELRRKAAARSRARRKAA